MPVSEDIGWVTLAGHHGRRGDRVGFSLEVGRVGIEPGSVLASVNQILAQAPLVALATAGPDGPHASPVFFAVDDALTLYFVSERTTRHTAGLAADGRISGAVFLDPPEYGEQLRGVQLHGSAGEVEPERRVEALTTYRGRFADFARDPAAERAFRAGDGPAAFYRFLVSDLVVLDEPRFGRRTYVTAVVRR
jgi:uncharacterized protein YhbP (UPF0306 family)